MRGTPLRIVFAGTPAFALPGLRVCLDAGVEVCAVYTQPDRPAGRGRALTPSPVKQAAIEAGISVEQPSTLKGADAQQRLRSYAPDLLIVIAYGLILPKAVLAIPRLACWNVHASLLPRWRGAAPIQRAILVGDSETGVCLMRMQAGLDTGPVLLERRTPILPDDTGGALHDSLAELGAEVLREGLQRAVRGEALIETPQPETGATYAHKIDKNEARLDFNVHAIELERKVRAFNPWPVAETDLAGERVRIWLAEARDSALGTRDLVKPGEIVVASKDGIDIACGEGILRILTLQRAGGRAIAAADYVNARSELRQQ